MRVAGQGDIDMTGGNDAGAVRAGGIAAAVALALTLGYAAYALVPVVRRDGPTRPAETEPSEAKRRLADPARYVATNGDDANPGTKEAPLRTISAATRRAAPGDLYYVREGVYRERPTFRTSGTKAKPIVFEAYPGESVTISRGFRVTGDHNILRRFAVTPGESEEAVFLAEAAGRTRSPQTSAQIQLTGSWNRLEGVSHQDRRGVTPAGVSSLTFVKGSHNVVTDLDFSYCRPITFLGQGAGEGTGTAEYNVISGGTVNHGTDVLLSIEADNCRVEGVDLHHPGQVGAHGNSADAINLNGDGIVLRGNRIHDVYAQYSYQHADAIQWWNRANDLVIEGNVIGSQEHGGKLGKGDQGHIQFSSEAQGFTSHRVSIRDNVFLGTDGYYIISGSPTQIRPGQADGWRVEGNEFRSGQRMRSDILQSTRGWRIQDDAL